MSHNPNRAQTATRHTVADGEIVIKNKAVTLTENGVGKINFTIPKLEIETIATENIGTAMAVLPISQLKLFVVYSNDTDSFAVIHNTENETLEIKTPLQLDKKVTLAKGIVLTNGNVIMCLRYSDGTGTVKTFSVTNDVITDVYTPAEALKEYSWDIVKLTDTKIILKDSTVTGNYKFAVVTVALDNSMTFVAVTTSTAVSSSYTIHAISSTKFYSVSGLKVIIWLEDNNAITNYKEINIEPNSLIRNFETRTFIEKKFLKIIELAENLFIASYAKTEGTFTFRVYLTQPVFNYYST